MSENDHDWAARRHQQDAANLWGSEGGSIAHWNAHLEGQRSQQLADAQRASDASARAAAAAQASSYTYPPASPPMPVGGHTGWTRTAGRATPVDDSQIGLVLWNLAKWTLLPLLLASALVVAAWYGAKAADRAWAKADPDGGLARYATARAFPGEGLTPATAHLSSRDRAHLLEGPALIAALRSARRPIAPGDARNARLLASAYACQTSDDCRMPLAEAAPDQQIALLDAAVLFLGTKVKAGSEPAARDGCLLPLLTGQLPQAVQLGRNACAMMLSANRKSIEARQHLATIDESGWFKLARVVAAEGF